MTRPVRIPGQRPDQWSDETRAVFDTTVGAGRSRPLHLPAVIAHHDALIGPYIEWAKAVALTGTLDPRPTALLALRCAWNCESAFEWGVHAERAIVAGALTAAEIERVGLGPAAGWAEHDAALLQAADDLRAEASIGAAAWATLREHHDTEQLVEITIVVGHYTMLSMIANTAGVPAEPYWAPLGEAPAT